MATVEDARRRSLEIWDEMAAEWDRQSDLIWQMSRPLGEWMVDKLGLSSGDTVLELAAGPGMTGMVAAKLVGDTGKLILSDFSPNMLEVARKKAGELGLSNVEFRLIDAEHIDLPDDSVDGVLCRWGYMLMMDPVKALTETRRVLRPSKRVAFSVWGTPAENPWATLAGMVMVSMGKMSMPDPNAPGGIFSMAEESTIEQMLDKAGFEGHEIVRIPVEWGFDSPEDLWKFYTELAGAISILLKELDEPSVAEVREEIIKQAETFRSGDGYLFPGVAVNAVAW